MLFPRVLKEISVHSSRASVAEVRPLLTPGMGPGNPGEPFVRPYPRHHAVLGTYLYDLTWGRSPNIKPANQSRGQKATVLRETRLILLNPAPGAEQKSSEAGNAATIPA
ncbi:hypothetical protein EVAR_22056_1 [Eumeta japonica]|uniref:Uncharacterized protein n=1 Tax=Eumeta variegata TaxID=151549 RepID=A0A4C1UUF5_EUMVA|nr:hypothetical protein EVAR_22056_1 [Eumeta japonica]